MRSCHVIKDGPVGTPLEDDGDAFRLAVKKCIFTLHHDLFLQFFNEEIKQDKNRQKQLVEQLLEQ